tara:strand:- start:16296 stop:16643 length:348 start_codon:yes stop_codon:yes gene_type:complete
MGVKSRNSLSFQSILFYAAAKNLKFEMYSEMLDAEGEKICFPKSYVGIELTPHCYFWWITDQKIDTSKRGFNFIPNRDAYLFFDHRYNRNTGTSIKGWKTGYNAEKKIRKYLNVE